MIAIHDLDHFLKKYTEFYQIKHKFKCKVGYFSGNIEDVDMPSLTSMHLSFKYIKGDNAHNYEKTRQELFNNIVVFHIASIHQLVHRTWLSPDGMAYLHIVFDKTYTPFDNCIDLKLLLYSRTVPSVIPIEDAKERKELIDLLRHIHAAGFIMNTPYVSKSLTGSNYVLSNYRHLVQIKVAKDTKEELGKFTKSITPCGSCMCGVFGR